MVPFLTPTALVPPSLPATVPVTLGAATVTAFTLLSVTVEVPVVARVPIRALVSCTVTVVVACERPKGPVA